MTLTLTVTLISLSDSFVQAYFRRNSMKAFLSLKHLFLIPLFSLVLTMGNDNACWFALTIYFLILTFKILILTIYLKDDFIYALLAPINLKFGLPFHHYIFNDALDWEYFFKRKIKPEIVKLFHQAIFYYEENQFEVSKKLKKNINNYHSTLNNIRQIES
ncbi:MAG: hypothetical protein O9340_08425 [Cyclobacteriaceae bacterium]|nr:hypothetical protein [Cyclobacteriaceae bacterium]